ncbi:MAG: GNAT family N-acetyltransferase [Actinobacteria bacterium]|nr:GNAT family N-acetyltransferase [Actinomycetota bacterium]
MTGARLADPGTWMFDDPLHLEWADLADRVGASPFARPGWVLAWAACRGVDVELIGVRREGALVAALPIVRAPEGVVTPTDWHTPRFEAIALDEEALADLAGTTVARRDRYLRLGFLDADGPTQRAFTGALLAGGYHLRLRTVLRSPYLRLSTSWEDYLAEWPSKRRSDLGRRRRRLDEQGAVAFEIHDGTERLDELLSEGFEVEASGWKGGQGTAIATEGTESLYRQAAAWAASQGTLRLGFLRVDGRAIAFDYCFEIGATHYLVKTGFRPEFSAFAPGKLLRAFMIETAFGRGLDTYDFVGDDDAWKMEWTDTVRTTVIMEAHAPGLLGSITRAAGFLGRVVRRLKRSMRRGHG